MAETSGGHAAESYLPENLRALRGRKGISQAAVADAMRDRGWPWHQTTVHRIESGQQMPGFGETVDLAHVLGVTTDRLTWSGPEAAESGEVAIVHGRLREAWRETAAAAARLHAARSGAERTIAERQGSAYARVRDAARGLAEELEGATLETALGEAAEILLRAGRGES
jgi:transcriptional regulator with XRE-family HTH domain